MSILDLQGLEPMKNAAPTRSGSSKGFCGTSTLSVNILGAVKC